MVSSQAPITGENRLGCWGLSFGFRKEYGDGIVYETVRNRVDLGGTG